MRKYDSRAACCSVAIVVLLIDACSTLPGGRRWGEDATIQPGWARVGQAAVDAATRPHFWVPLLAAGLMQIDGWDRRVSNWSRRETPVFGSEANAALWSNRLRSTSVVIGWTSVALAPSGPIDVDWLIAKVKGGAVDFVAAESAIEFTSGLKRLTGRERPDGSDDLSLPSDHTATSAVYDELAAENLRLSGLDRRIELGADIMLGGVTAATGWARIEAGAHFPSDTLVGASIGHFFADFFTGGFLAQVDGRPPVLVQSVPGGATLQWSLAF